MTTASQEDRDRATFVEPVLGESEARLRCTRRRWQRVRTAWSRLAPRLLDRPVGRRLLRMEQIWLPCYHVAFRVENQDGRLDGLDVLVGGYDGKAAVWDLTGLGWLPPCGEQFTPSLTAGEARQIAHQALCGARWQRSRWRRGPVAWEVQAVRLVHYPFWAAYYARRRQQLDVAVWDAVTGQPTGPSGKVSLLAALTRSAGNAPQNLD